MTIPTPYLWPLGCLVLIGLFNVAILIEEVVHHVARRLHDAIQRQEEV
jgi:hypothetical protein